MKSQVVCTKCGNETERVSSFCVKCGERLPMPNKDYLNVNTDDFKVVTPNKQAEQLNQTQAEPQFQPQQQFQNYNEPQQAQPQQFQNYNEPQQAQPQQFQNYNEPQQAQPQQFQNYNQTQQIPTSNGKKSNAVVIILVVVVMIIGVGVAGGAWYFMSQDNEEGINLNYELEGAEDTVPYLEDALQNVEEALGQDDEILLAEQETAKILAEQETARLLAEQETARILAEQEATRLLAEQETARILAEQEAARLLAEQATTAGYYILKHSNTAFVTSSELKSLSTEQLRIARNEIYARHGYAFTSEDLRLYFGNQGWYRNTYANVTQSDLNEYEIKNIETIKAEEALRN